MYSRSECWHDFWSTLKASPPRDIAAFAWWVSVILTAILSR